MKIKIHAKDGPRHLTLHLPLAFLCTKLFARILSQNDETPLDVDAFHQQAKEAYRSLKKFIKANGHFDLVEVRSAEGDHIQIRL